MRAELLLIEHMSPHDYRWDVSNLGPDVVLRLVGTFGVELVRELLTPQWTCPAMLAGIVDDLSLAVALAFAGLDA